MLSLDDLTVQTATGQWQFHQRDMTALYDVR